MSEVKVGISVNINLDVDEQETLLKANSIIGSIFHQLKTQGAEKTITFDIVKGIDNNLFDFLDYMGMLE